MCSPNTTKNSLNFFNIIFLVAGLAVLAIAIWTMIDRYQYVTLLTSLTYPIIVYFLLAAGGLAILIAVLGCYAALKENNVLLIIYIFLMVFIVLIHGMVGILAFIYGENVQTELQMTLNDTFMTDYKVDTTKTKAVDFLQNNFKCCGSDSFTDWKYSEWLKNPERNTTNIVPDSCCKTVSEGCGWSDHPSNINYAGCKDRMAAHMKDHLFILSILGAAMFMFQIIGIILACNLYFKLKSSSNDDIHDQKRFLDNNSDPS